MKNKLILSIAFVFGFISFSFSQFIAHELGVTVGGVSFQSDYGERGDFKSTANNMGVNLGLVYYADFSWLSSYRSGYIEDHFKLKAEVSYTSAKFKHYGKWAETGSTFSNQLKAMHGSTSIINLGLEAVWFPISIKDSRYHDNGKFNPYISFGGQMNFFSPKVESDLGPMGSPISTPNKYMNAYQNSPGQTFSLVGSLGTRYKVDANSDITLDLRAQHFMSDWVDGLNPNPKIYKENNKNDFLIAISIGYIYYFE